MVDKNHSSHFEGVKTIVNCLMFTGHSPETQRLRMLKWHLFFGRFFSIILSLYI